MTELSFAQSILTILAVSVIYIYLVASVYPWLTMHLSWCKKKPYTERGLLRVRFPEGRGIVYQPDPRVRRYIPRYALFTVEGKKYIRLRVDQRVNYIRYDVVTFDRRGRLLDVLEVAERLASAGSTRAVRLPTATAYASVIPRRVDGEYTGKEMAVGYSPLGVGIFTGLTVLTTVFVGVMFHSELSYLAAEMGGFAVAGLGRVLVASLLLGIACSLWVLFMHYLHAVRRINR